MSNDVGLTTSPLSISEDLITEELTCDVAVVGAGTAGMAATVSAAEEGVKVMLIEKTRSFTGRGGENAALNSKLHRQCGIQIDVDEVVRRLMEFSGYKADERLIRLWALNSGKVMDWIIDICAEAAIKTWLVIPSIPPIVIDKWPPSGVSSGWDYKKETPLEYPVDHRFGDTPSANQLLLLSALEKKARKLGVNIMYNMKAVKLERPADGRVTAVIAKNKDGDYIRINVDKGVVLATGDYSNNKLMVKYYLPENVAKLVPLAYGMDGAGHLMACWVGAQMESRPHPALFHAFHVLGMAPFLMVDKNGKRFVNENLDPVFFANQCLEVGGCWVIFDSDWPKYVNTLTPKVLQIWKVAEKTRLKEIVHNRERNTRKLFPWMVKKLEPDLIVEGETLDELAQKMMSVTPEIDINIFKATVHRYNELCKKGVDMDYGKRPDRLFPLSSPPFYAQWKKSALFLVTLGGLIVNEKLQTIDKYGKPIPGLHCAGNTIGRRFGLYYPLMLPGLSHGMALTYGYIAGKNVSKEA